MRSHHDPEPVLISNPDGWYSPPNAIIAITRDDGFNFYMSSDELYISHSTVRKMYKLKEREISELLPVPCLLTANPHRPSTKMRLYRFNRVLDSLPDTRA